MLKINRFGRNIAGSMFLLASAVLLSASAMPPRTNFQDQKAQKLGLSIDSSVSKVRWELGGSLHDVHGSFQIARGKVSFDPSNGRAGGEIVVDAKSGESGNNSRDKKMHKDVLESAKFGEIAFHPDRVEGKVSLVGSSAVQVHGTFEIHGSMHELTIPMQVEFSTDHWKGSGKFKVPYSEWGMKNPSNFFLKVDSSVDVEVEISGNLQSVSEKAD